MNIHIFDLLLFCKFQKRVAVILACMDIARRDQSDQVEGRAVLFRMHGCFEKCFVVKKGFVRNALIDTWKCLIIHATGTDIEVPDFGIPHFAKRQTHLIAGCKKGHNRIFPNKPVDCGGLGFCNGVAISGWRYAPAV